MTEFLKYNSWYST